MEPLNNIINYNLCMSRKNMKDNIYVQCNNKKKNGDYCGIHCKCKSIIRIDEHLDIAKIKKQNIKLNEKPNILKKYNYYSLKDLQEIARKYNIKYDTFKKKEIYKKINEFLNVKNKYENDIAKIIKVQSLYRGFILRLINKLRGPGFLKKKLINNEEDFYTMEGKYEIDNMYFF